ncbi:MAG: hypothetical protein JWP04_3603 [Belnapia sp.]|jgi:hypothetical protein|nr:hypothetical protein [Belnapia sp.]
MPTDTKTNTVPYENLTSSRGPHAPQRDKSVEHQYDPSPGENNNRTDAEAPGGPVNIKVKGGAPDDTGPDAVAPTEDKATGQGGRDSSAGLPQE